MRRAWRLSAVGLAALAALGLTASAAAQPAGSVDHGRFLVLQGCAGCHGVGELGASPNPRAPTFPMVRSSLSRPQLRAVLGRLSRNGHVEMPPIYMSDQDIADIAAYIGTLRARPRQSGPVRRL